MENNQGVVHKRRFIAEERERGTEAEGTSHRVGNAIEYYSEAKMG